jgi:hypothetical protein
MKRRAWQRWIEMFTNRRSPVNEHSAGIRKGLQVREGVERVSCSGLTILLDRFRGEYFGLNPLGSRIWNSVAEGKPLSQLVVDVCKESEATQAMVEADIAAFVALLIKQKLIESP